MAHIILKSLGQQDVQEIRNKIWPAKTVNTMTLMVQERESVNKIFFIPHGTHTPLNCLRETGLMSKI